MRISDWSSDVCSSDLNDDEFSDGDHALDRHCDRGRRVDDGKLEALLTQRIEIGLKPSDRGLRKGGHVRLVLVTPVGKPAFGFDIHQHVRTSPRKSARSSGRTRVCQDWWMSVGAVSYTTKTKSISVMI